MSKIINLRNRVEQQKGKRIQIQQSIDVLKVQITLQDISLRENEQAKEVILEVGKKTQEKLSYHISDITSLALDAVFDNPYELVSEFVQRRNKTECDLYFSRDGNRINPLEASGGGAVDVAAFALRIASWSMQTPRRRNTIILDEPLRYLDKEKQEKASRMIKELSDKLGLQFIIITHETTLTEYADKIFRVTIKKGISNVVSG